MPRLHPRALRRLTLAGAATVTMFGCYPTPQAPEAPPLVMGEAAFSQSVVIDVDALRGAAFERPTRGAGGSYGILQAVNVSGALRVAVEFPNVSHDAATGRTTVTMQITNAGDSLTYLKCTVGGDRKVVSPAWGFNTTIAKAGATQTVDLVFENPGGGGFSASFNFTGTLNPKTSLPVGTGSGATPTPAPTATPTSAPTATPTAAPTATPTVAPTATPTPAPTATPTAPPATGGLSATASSSYGSLTPEKVLDGNLSSQWSNDGYQQPTAWLMLDAGSVKPVSSLGLKMRPQSGTSSYVIETSTDGQTFQAATGALRNTTWNTETKAFDAPTQARYVRVRFTNDAAAPEVRFSVFEALWNGTANTGGSTPAATPTPAPTATPTPTPVPTSTATTPPSGTSLNVTFDQYAEGTEPGDWKDVRDDGYNSYAWLVDAPWRIATHNGSKQYMHDGLSNQANLSFRRYTGTAFGADGALPNRYFTELQVTPIKSYTYAPTGDQGTQFFYLDPTNYVEWVIKPNYVEVWVANNAVPFQGAGWNRIYYTSVNTAAGQTRRLGAEVDAVAHTAKIYLDGEYLTTVTTSKLDTRTHYYALRGTGNIVVHDNVKIEPR